MIVVALVRQQRALQPLARDGWQIAHGVDWPGGGDLDHLVRSPSGMGFVIETKTLRWTACISRAQSRPPAGWPADAGATHAGSCR